MPQISTTIALAATWTTIVAAPLDKTVKIIQLFVNNRSGVVADLQSQNQGTDSDAVAIADAGPRFPMVAAVAELISLGDEPVEVWENFQMQSDQVSVDVTAIFEEWPSDPYPLNEG